MDVIFELQAFDQNTMLGFPKKARKIHFCDPFIMETVARWLVSERRGFSIRFISRRLIISVGLPADF